MGISRMNKKGLEFKSTLFSIVAISLMVIAFGVIINQQESFYDSNATSELEAYNKLDEISDTSGSYRNRLTESDSDPGQDAEANTFRGVYGILAGIFGSFDIILGSDGILDNLVTQFGLPSYVRQGLISFLLISIAFSLIAIIFRLSRRSA